MQVEPTHLISLLSELFECQEGSYHKVIEKELGHQF